MGKNMGCKTRLLKCLHMIYESHRFDFKKKEGVFRPLSNIFYSGIIRTCNDKIGSVAQSYKKARFSGE